MFVSLYLYVFIYIYIYIYIYPQKKLNIVHCEKYLSISSSSSSS